MDTLTSAGHSLYFESGLAELKILLDSNKYSKIFVFVDENTSEICLPVFQSILADFTNFDVIETAAGEENKTIDFCIGIWQTLLDFEADRKSLMINLGGGVVTDMGGFIASTYKRGIDFVNVPTTLLAQVDASVGGKTGIDIDHVKNMVGTFALPQMVFIETEFLKTLPQRELRSGFAEMIKHGLIFDKTYYEKLKTTNYLKPSADDIYRSVEIKNEVVTIDPQEKHLRKILNFGHTIGHAIEGYSLMHDEEPLTHGEAIAIGFICEAALSVKNSTLNKNELKDISDSLLSIYPKYQIKTESFDNLLELMQSDKKNEDGYILFSLLESIGKCTFNCRVANSDILKSLEYYNSL